MRQIHQVKASLLPVHQPLFYQLTRMNFSTIQHQASWSFYPERKPFELLDNESRINAFSSSGPVALIGARNHPKAIQAGPFTGGNKDIFVGKLPLIAVRSALNGHGFHPSNTNQSIVFPPVFPIHREFLAYEYKPPGFLSVSNAFGFVYSGS